MRKNKKIVKSLLIFKQLLFKMRQNEIYNVGITILYIHLISQHL